MGRLRGWSRTPSSRTRSTGSSLPQHIPARTPIPSPSTLRLPCVREAAGRMAACGCVTAPSILRPSGLWERLGVTTQSLRLPYSPARQRRLEPSIRFGYSLLLWSSTFHSMFSICNIHDLPMTQRRRTWRTRGDRGSRLRLSLLSRVRWWRGLHRRWQPASPR